jgi:hypothetical protein
LKFLHLCGHMFFGYHLSKKSSQFIIIFFYINDDVIVTTIIITTIMIMKINNLEFGHMRLQ